MNSADTLNLAMQQHQAGNLREAEQCYRQILQVEPGHADAMYLLGVIAHQLGRFDEAVSSHQHLLRVKPDIAEAHYSLGIALAAQGRLDEAVASYQQAVRLRPDYAEACNNLGNVLKDQGRFEEAAASYQQALRLKPDIAELHYNLGMALAAQRRLEEAVASYRQAVRLRPDYAEAHNNLGNALQGQGKLEEAITCYRQALQLKPDFVGTYLNLGKALQDQGKLEEAVSSFQQALRLKPDLAGAYLNLGNALSDQGKLEEAIASYRKVLHLKPDLAEAYCNLGNALQHQLKLDDAVINYHQALRLKPDFAGAHCNLAGVLKMQGKLAEAAASIERALALQPDYADAHANLGVVLQAQGKFDEAAASLRHALRLKPDFAEAHNTLGNVLKYLGKLNEAISNYRQALRLKPDFVTAHDNLLMALHYHPDYDSAALYQEARRWNEQYAEPLAIYRQAHANSADPERRLRIGYVSPDFRVHAVSFAMVPLLSNHDHREVEIYCYADVPQPDGITERLRGCADVWRATAGLTDEQIAGMVRQDRIDILVDLALHTAGNRLLVFARKPAPVQVTWQGYPGTTGLSAIDYRLTDPYLDPPGANDSCYSEKSIRLPDTFWCYDPLVGGARDDSSSLASHLSPLVPPSVLPALANGFITFGCLNNFCKVNDGVLVLWAKVLRAVPRSRLLLLAPRGEARERVLTVLQQEGIDEPRVEFADQQPRQQYLQTYNRIDLGLDPLPYNGHTTSLDAFWMGVPTVTLIDKTVVGRAGWSQLCNLDLKELAAATPEQYVALAAELAADLPRLRELRATLRQRMARSPLMDANRFARHVEQAFRQMWRGWCQSV